MKRRQKKNICFDIEVQMNVLMDHENEFFIYIDQSYLVWEDF